MASTRNLHLIQVCRMQRHLLEEWKQFCGRCPMRRNWLLDFNSFGIPFFFFYPRGQFWRKFRLQCNLNVLITSIYYSLHVENSPNLIIFIWARLLQFQVILKMREWPIGGRTNILIIYLRWDVHIINWKQVPCDYPNRLSVLITFWNN